MSIAAFAIVKIPYPEVCRAHGLAPASTRAEARTATPPFLPVGADGTALRLEGELDAGPDALFAETAARLGPVLAKHADSRGIMLLPEVVWKALPEEANYEAALEEAGDMGEWAEPPVMPAGMAPLAAMGVAGGEAMPRGGGLPALSPEDLQAATQMLANNPAAAKAAQAAMESLTKGEMGGAGNLMQMAQEMLSNMSPAQRASLEQMAMSMLEGEGSDDDE